MIILIHPLCLLFIFCMIDTIRAFPEKSVLQKLTASISGNIFLLKYVLFLKISYPFKNVLQNSPHF